MSKREKAVLLEALEKGRVFVMKLARSLSLFPSSDGIPPPKQVVAH